MGRKHLRTPLSRRRQNAEVDEGVEVATPIVSPRAEVVAGANGGNGGEPSIPIIVAQIVSSSDNNHQQDLERVDGSRAASRQKNKNETIQESEIE